MIWLLYALLPFLSLFGYLLLAPLYLEINSLKGLFRIRFHRLGSAVVQARDNSFFLDIKFVGFRRSVDLLAPKPSMQKKVSATPSKQKKQNPKISWKKIKAVLHSFKVNKLALSVDTGDNGANGVLFPLFYWAARASRKNININFCDENYIILEIENNAARMLWAYVKP